MPPKKLATDTTKSKPTSDDNKATEMILKYLVDQNRPYSATEISANLHNAVTKTRTDKLLKEMFERGEIGGRASGKQWVFWGLQDPNASITPEELASIDAEIAGLRETLPNLKMEVKSKNSALASIRSAPSTDVLRDTVNKLLAQKEEIEQRLRVLKSGSIKPVSSAEKQQVESEWKRWRRTREVRKRGFLELEGMLLDSGIMKREDLWEKLGLEADP